VLTEWLRQRKSNVTIEVTSSDGRSVRVAASQVDQAHELIRQVLETAEER